MNNTLKYVRILENTGITREQAEAHVYVLSEFLEGDLATKQDIKNLDIKLENLAINLEHKILQSEYRMTIKLGSIVTVVIAASTAIIKLF